MSRRKREPGRLFDAAFDNLNVLERAVVKASVPVNFTMDDVAALLWPPETVDLLKRAFPLTTNYLTSWGSKVEHGDITFHLYANWHKIGMLYPKPPVELQTNIHALFDTVRVAQKIVQDMDVVREVVTYFNDHGTPGSAQHYFPQIASLLPADHPINDVGKGAFREPCLLGPMLPKIRQASTTLAAALLCPHDSTMPNDFRFMIYTDPALITSQIFGLF